MEEDEPTGFVKYEKFEPVVVKAIEDNEIPTDSEEDVFTDFRGCVFSSSSVFSSLLDKMSALRFAIVVSLLGFR